MSHSDCRFKDVCARRTGNAPYDARRCIIHSGEIAFASHINLNIVIKYAFYNCSYCSWLITGTISPNALTQVQSMYPVFLGGTREPELLIPSRYPTH